jgi:clan AA aspartic protease (TIGR02281 family)
MTAPDLPAQGETGIVRIPRDSFTGHFVARVLINGVRVRAVIDTGAVSTVLSPDAARATGAINDITHTMPAAGIGGVTMLNVTRVRSFVIGGRNIGGFDAMIGAGAIQDTLLGQTELRKLGRIVIEDDVLTIEPKGGRLAAR